jgi:dihydrofolate synthase/folylpolyglutamate synthase
LIMTEPDFHKKGNASELAKLAQELLHDLGREVNVIVEPDWKRALDLLQQTTRQSDLAVVSGTLYLISDVRSWLLHQTASEKGW